MRRFESRDGNPRRFWEIELRWNEYAVRSGAIGGEPQTRKKSFPDAATAARVVEEMIEEKRSEGFLEDGVEPEPAPPPPPADAVPAPLPAASPPPPAPAPSATTPADPSILRRFEYVGGGSKKFWEVQVTGVQYVVRFGRIGTKGQSKSKTFPDAAAAVREAATLMAEKVGKGYVEVARDGAARADGDDQEDE